MSIYRNFAEAKEAYSEMIRVLDELLETPEDRLRKMRKNINKIKAVYSKD